MNMDEEEFVQLKWNTHQLAFFNTLSSLRDKQVFTDVTLSCGDQFYPAHRLVLSACSIFLARTLEIVSCKAPVVLLHGIDQSTLEQLLMFMYDGQVTISRNELPKLLKAAQWLEVKGLDSTDDALSEHQSPDEYFDSSPFLKTLRQSFSSLTGTSMQQENVENAIKFYKQITNKMQENQDANDQSSKSMLDLSEAEASQETDESKISISDLNLDVNSLTNPASEEVKDRCSPTRQMMGNNSSSAFSGWMDNEFDSKDIIEKSSAAAEVNSKDSSSAPDESTENSKENKAAGMSKRSLKCKHCGKCFKVRKDMARHLRIHHDLTTNYCFTCQAKFSNKREYSMHMKLHKAQKLYACNMCDFVSHNPYGLKKHILVQHRTSLESDAIIPEVQLIEGSEAKSRAKSNAILPEVQLVEGSKPKARTLQKSLQNSDRTVCTICQKIFKNETMLGDHIDKGCQGIIRSKKGYHCPLCMYVADRMRSVEDHVARHTGKFRFRCSYCPYQCVRNSYLQTHVRKRHPECK